MQLSVIIVNYNVKYFLEQCLYSVMKAIKNLDAEILVVDNCSTDGSKDYFLNKFETVRFIWNDRNAGFSKANNMAEKIARGDYILFLNPDTIVPEDCFEKCLSFFHSHQGAGALGTRMLDGAGNFLKESKRSFPSPLTSLYKLSGLTRLFPRSGIFAKYHLGNLDPHKTHEVDVLAGAFMMIPKKVIESIGNFDEKFFMYGEDVDLSYRIQKAGYKNFYFSDCAIVHFKGESTKKGSLNYITMFYGAMSIFAGKHYGGTKAGFYNLMIQGGIAVRAMVAALAKFIRWIGLPVIDAALILLSFWIVKMFWSIYIRQEVNYSPNMLLIAFPVFTMVFLGASFFSGLYDNGYKQGRLNKSTLFAFFILLAGYSLLPETLRFSRGILVFGSLLAYLFMTVIRKILVGVRAIEKSNENDEHRQTIVVGSVNDFASVHDLMHSAGIEQRVLGRVAVNGNQSNAIGNLSQMGQLLRSYPIREIIFCEGDLSFKKIIELVEKLPRHARLKFHAAGSQSIIGSENRYSSGKFVSSDKIYRLALPVHRRNKALNDVVVSCFFIITFPMHLILQRRPGSFFKNVFAVVMFKKTWVGYALSENQLPFLKKGVLTSTGLPASKNSLPEQSLASSDRWYVTDYSVWQDIRMIRKNYRFLSA
ncbi:MAG: glycosyltransferase [Ginsengibacter sp.]